MERKNASYARSTYPPERTRKLRVKGKTPRKQMGHNREKARLMPLITVVFLLLVTISPLSLLFYGDNMIPVVEGSPVATVSGTDDNDHFGWNVSGAGDVNGDGYDDIIVGAPGSNTFSAGGQWWNIDWAFRKRITFDNSGQSETLMNFPVLLNLSTSNFDYSKVQPAGLDLRFIDADGATELKYHIEDWNASGNSYVWVNVTNIDANSDTDYIWMYYGNPSAINAQDVQGTYDDNFVGVWHLNETVMDEQTTGTHYDSTSNKNDGSQNGSDDTSGKMYKGQYFDGIDDTIDCGNKSNLDVNYITIEFWVWINSWIDDAGILAKGDNTYRQYWIWTYGNEVSFEIDEAPYQNYAWSPSLGQWEHLVLTYNGTNVTTYRNGLQENIYPQSTGAIDPTPESLLFGYIPSYNYFDGALDEVRISNMARSADWISAQYLSMTDNFFTFGSEEEVGYDSGRAYIFFGGPWFTGNLMAQNANVTLKGDAPGDLFGWDVSGAGDVNDDGFDDVVIGAPGADAAYIIFGNATIKTSDFIPDTILNETFESGSFSTNGWTTQNGSLNDGGAPYQTPFIHMNASNGNNPSSTLGAELQGGDDTDNLDGEGFTSSEDPFICIASDTSLYKTVSVTYSRASRETQDTHEAGEDFRVEWTVNNWTTTFQSENTNIRGNLEGTVAPANPVWGQRTVLLPLAASNTSFQLRFSSDASWEGESVYVDDVLIVGTTGKFIRFDGYSGSLFGSSVSDAGDVNNDGFDDVLVGASGYDNGRGTAHIYFGSSVMDSISVPDGTDVILYGDNAGDRFGLSVSGIGDVDNDGFDDIIVGAPGSNKAVVFLKYSQDNPFKIMLLDDFEDGILADWYEEESANGAASVGNSGGAINGTLHLTDTDDTDVVSPIIDVRNYSNITLTYKRRMRDGDWSGNEDIRVMIRVDGGPWTSIPSEEAHGDTQTPDIIENRSVDLSSYGVNNSIIEIKFDLNDGGFFDTPQQWDFDDVQIIGKPYFSHVVLEGEYVNTQFGFSVSGAGDVDNNGYDDIIIGAPSAVQWWDENWSYRKKLSFDNSGQTETLMNFPVLINLTSSFFNYSRAAPNGTDLRFIDTDGITQLKYHIEEWNQSGYSYIWVNVTEIDAGSSQDHIWMYYGNPTAPDVQDQAGTYDETFAAVWHLAEDPGPGGAGDIKDTTSNNNHGTAEASMTSGDSVTGKIGRGMDFDGSDDYIDCGIGPSLNISNAITIEAWAKTYTDNGGTIASKHGAGDYGWVLHRRDMGDSLGVIWSINGTSYVTPETAADTFEVNISYHLVITFDGSNIRAYINGVEDTGGDFPYSYAGLNISATSTQIARDGYMGTDPAYMFNGTLDEVRISNTARSADWIKAQFLSMDNNFITYGSEEVPTTYPGKAYIFDGSYIIMEDIGDGHIDLSSGDNANVTLTGAVGDDLFGYSVSAGNLTGDAFSDIIVGAPGAYGNGEVYVFYGDSALPPSISASSANLVEQGQSSMDYYGWSVSGAGDVLLADNYHEVIIGAPFHDPGIKTDSGKAYLLRGISRPLIRDITALPAIQAIGGYVNITCNATAPNGIQGTWVNITLPGGGYTNISMSQGPGEQWYYINAYLTNGIYQYTIWASDTNGNWTQSNILQFEIINSQPILSFDIVNPLTGFTDTGFNFTVTYTDLDDHAPGTITVNITNYGIFTLIEVNPSDTDHTDGKAYYYTCSGFQSGTSYSFHFAAHDGIGDWVETVETPGPQVLNSPAVLISPDVNPLIGNGTSDFNFTVTYMDIDNNPPVTTTLNLTGPSGGTFTLMEIDPSDVDYSDGKLYSYVASGLTIGSYSLHFAAFENGGGWIESGILAFDVLNLLPALSQGQVAPVTGFDDSMFNFTVTYTDLDGHAPDTITVNITGLGIYQLNEVDTLDMDYTDGKSYYLEITSIPLGTSYTFHFAANDTLGYWAVETPEIDAPDVVQRTATLTAMDESVEYSDAAYLNASLMESGTPIAGEDVEFYIDLNDNGMYEPVELIGSATTLGDGRVSLVYSAYLVPGTYYFTAVYVGSGGFDVNDSYAQLTIVPKPATLTAVSRIAEEDELISLSATLQDSDGTPIAGEGVEIYLDKNRNTIYEASEAIGIQTTSAAGIASILYTVILSPGDYNMWARYMGSGNYSVAEIKGILVVQNTSNTPPTIQGVVPDQVRPEDCLPWTLDLTIYESDIEDPGSALKWYITGIDTSLYSVTGHNSTDDVFTFIPVENAFGNDEVTLWLVDSSSDVTFQVMWVNITPVNDLPYFDPNPPDIFVHYDDPGTADDDPSPWDYSFYVHDIETALQDLAILTSEPTEDSGNGYVEVTGMNVTYHFPQSRVGDSILVTLTLFDGTDSTQTVIMVNVTSEWVPELVLNLPDVTIEENTTIYSVFDLDDYFSDRDNDSLFFSSGYQHLTVVINADNTVDITAHEQWTGSELITFRAMDPTGAIVEDTITVTVVPVNDGPVISGAPDLNIHYDYSYGFDFTPYIEDPDNSHSELLLWTSESTDNIWVQESNNLGIVANYPESMDGMTFPVTIFVSDGVYTASQVILITISDNFPPELLYNLPDVSFDEDTLLEDAILLSYYFLDIDGDALYFSNGSTFINVVINSDRTVDFSAPENWNGFETVTFRATDPTGSIAEDTIIIVVVPVNDPPTIDSIPDQEMNEGDQWVLDLSQYIDDIDNEKSELTITVDSRAGQGYVTLSGTILVFQYPEGIATDVVTVTVSDGELETQRNFTVTMHSHTPVAPSIWNSIPWLWIFFISIAVMSGVFAFYASKRRYNVYEAFLIHEDGQPISHASHEEDSDLEDVAVSGMFAAVQEFIQDAFSGKTQDDNWKLDEMKFGDNKILIERSENLYLAAIFEGNGERLGSRMRRVLNDINEKYSGILADWDGDTAQLAGINAVIGALISKKSHRDTVSQTEIPRDANSDAAHQEEEDIVVNEGWEKENYQEEKEGTTTEEEMLFLCPECNSEIGETDVRCPVCGVAFSEMNDMDSESKEEDNESDNLKNKEEAS